MNDLLSIFKEFTPGAYGIWSGVLMFAAWWLREWRETRKLSAEDRLARRDGYAKQVEMLMGENRGLRSDLAAMEKRHSDYRTLCHQETDQLRDQVVHLENKIAGLMRKLADVAVRAARGEVDASMAASILQLATEAEPRPPMPQPAPRTKE
jgi:hypothetical protein